MGNLPNEDAVDLEHQDEFGFQINMMYDMQLISSAKLEKVVRFTPEASGYLHIGHAKEALLCQHYALFYNGCFIIRFDDTNPVKEEFDFVKVILEDIGLLKINPDMTTYTSDYFDQILDMCENILIKGGLAYVDDTDADKMHLEYEQNIESTNRNNSIEKNLELWKQMLLGREIGLKCCVRAKIDIQGKNVCLKDPIIYRCKIEPHFRTANKYKVYPTYDFACPIVDSLEGVTHCLRTNDLGSNLQYYWFRDSLNLGNQNNETTKPEIWLYNKINIPNTVLSKRKLNWFVEQGHVDGWDDPRMPTIRGLLRRGLLVDTLKEFSVGYEMSRNCGALHWDNIWIVNNTYINFIASRHIVLLVSDSISSHPPVEVIIENIDKPYKLDNVAGHPYYFQLVLNNRVWAAPKILINYNDAELLEVGCQATFINLGNLLINRIMRNSNSNVIEKIYAITNLENTDYRTTEKVIWLPSINSSEPAEVVLPILVPVLCVYFKHLIRKQVLEKNDNFKEFLTEQSRLEIKMVGDSELKNICKGDIIHLHEKGYFICDSPYQPYSNHTGKESPVVLFNIPSEYDEKFVISKTFVPASVPVNKYKKKLIFNPTTKTTGSNKKLGLQFQKLMIKKWYFEVLIKAEMIEFYGVRGCYVLRPWAYGIWEIIQQWFDLSIKNDPLNVSNCYFPEFISKAALKKEKKHTTDYLQEIVWVTKSGDSDLAKDIAIRPTSETAMYSAFAKWIKSHRDLPLKLNQWNNVAQWESKTKIMPFLKTREFLWQEGHHAYAKQEEAERDVLIILDYYEYVYRKMLAVPVIKGKITEKKIFPDGDYTTTCVVYIPDNGNAMHGATSNYLGTHFANKFQVQFDPPENREQTFAHLISYRMSTRTIGVMVMVHGDDRGLVLPPRVATVQVIIVPCGMGAPNKVKETLINTCLKMCKILRGNITANEIDNGNINSIVPKGNPSIIIRANSDVRLNHTPGWKFNHWELKGVPLRLELGPKDLDQRQIIAVRRDTNERIIIPIDPFQIDKNGNFKLIKIISKLLDKIQNDMLAKAENDLNQNVLICRNWNEFKFRVFEGRLVLIPFCGRPTCENNIELDTFNLIDSSDDRAISDKKVQSFCVPFEQPKGDEKLASSEQCIHPKCEKLARSFTLFGQR